MAASIAFYVWSAGSSARTGRPHREQRPHRVPPMFPRESVRLCHIVHIFINVYDGKAPSRSYFKCKYHDVDIYMHW